jgi:sugar (glycoside-pentoside-hexuronide) transporter
MRAGAVKHGTVTRGAERHSRQRVPRPVILGFSIGSLGTGIFSVTPSVLLLYFMTDILGIAAALAALAVSVPKLWDVVTDPVMGMISDRTRSRWGRRRPYLLIGAILMSVSFVFLFSVPESLSVAGRFWYVFVIFTLSATAYTIFAVPYITMPAEMSADTHERTVIMTYRMVFATAGLLIGASVAPMLVDWFGGGRAGYASMSYVVGGFCAATMMVTVFSTQSVKATTYTPSSLPIKEQLLLGLRNRPFFVLLSAYFLQLMGLATFLAAAPFFVVYVTGAGAGATGLIFLCLMGSGLVSMPFWAAMSRRFGKLNCYTSAVILYAFISLGLVFIDGEGTGTFLYVLCAVLGIPFGCIMMMPFSMMTDAVRFDSIQTGLHREGVFTGLWTAGEKGGLALGPMIAGVFLSLFGFAEASGGTAVEQTTSAIWGIRLAFAIAPSVIVLGSLLILRLYDLDEETLALGEKVTNSI